MNTNTRIESFLNVYSPPRREKTRRWETSFRSLFTGQPSYLPELSGPQPLEDGPAETQNRRRAPPSPQSGRLWAKSRRTVLRTKAPREHSSQKEVRTSCGGKRASQRVQGKPTSTRPEVIDTTRQRQHREDHEDGHRYCGGSRRQAICICPAVIHQKQPELHLTAKRRTTTFSRCAKGA